VRVALALEQIVEQMKLLVRLMQSVVVMLEVKVGKDTSLSDALAEDPGLLDPGEDYGAADLLAEPGDEDEPLVGS
jgi:hypothetical protein